MPRDPVYVATAELRQPLVLRALAAAAMLGAAGSLGAALWMMLTPTDGGIADVGQTIANLYDSTALADWFSLVSWCAVLLVLLAVAWSRLVRQRWTVAVVLVGWAVPAVLYAVAAGQQASAAQAAAQVPFGALGSNGQGVEVAGDVVLAVLVLVWAVLTGVDESAQRVAVPRRSLALLAAVAGLVVIAVSDGMHGPLVGGVLGAVGFVLVAVAIAVYCTAGPWPATAVTSAAVAAAAVTGAARLLAGVVLDAASADRLSLLVYGIGVADVLGLLASLLVMAALLQASDQSWAPMVAGTRRPGGGWWAGAPGGPWVGPPAPPWADSTGRPWAAGASGQPWGGGPGWRTPWPGGPASAAPWAGVPGSAVPWGGGADPGAVPGSAAGTTQAAAPPGAGQEGAGQAGADHEGAGQAGADHGPVGHGGVAGSAPGPARPVPGVPGPPPGYYPGPDGRVHWWTGVAWRDPGPDAERPPGPVGTPPG
jgi:hypothetical protein